MITCLPPPIEWLGPSEITIYRPEVFMAIDGPHTECTKSEVSRPADRARPHHSLEPPRPTYLRDFRASELALITCLVAQVVWCFASQRGSQYHACQGNPHGSTPPVEPRVLQQRSVVLILMHPIPSSMLICGWSNPAISMYCTYLTHRLALQLHEAKILRHVDRLDRCIQADVDCGQPSDAKNLMYWFGFDAMGDFVFNHPFGMLESKTWHHIMVRSYRAVELLGPFGPAPWLVHIGFRILPRLSYLRDWHEMTTWCRQTMEQRLENEVLQKELDMTHYLMMQEDPEHGGVSTEEYSAAREHNRFWVHGDSLLMIVAGRCVLT